MSNVYIVWGEHPEEDGGYYLGVADSEEGALILAVEGIASRVDGEWDEYDANDVESLKTLINEKKYGAAIEHWNDQMSGFHINIIEQQLSSTTAIRADFHWPED